MVYRALELDRVVALAFIASSMAGMATEPRF